MMIINSYTKLLPNRRKASGNSGFTLMELLLAVVIFSLILGAVYSSFRAGLQMYRLGSIEKQVFQESRLLQNFVQRDLRSVLAIDETTYDIPPFPVDTTSSIDFSTDTSWVPDETNYSLSPYPFYGTVSSISLYSYGQVPLGTIRGLRGGIFEVNYTYDKGSLLRKANEITGSVTENEDLVHRIQSIQINYGFKKEGKWTWVDNWDSKRTNNRTPKSDDDEKSIFDVNRHSTIRVYPDNLPEAVRITLILEEPNNPKAPGREFEWLTEIPAAKPTIKLQ